MATGDKTRIDGKTRIYFGPDGSLFTINRATLAIERSVTHGATWKTFGVPNPLPTLSLPGYECWWHTGPYVDTRGNVYYWATGAVYRMDAVTKACTKAFDLPNATNTAPSGFGWTEDTSGYVYFGNYTIQSGTNDNVWVSPPGGLAFVPVSIPGSNRHVHVVRAALDGSVYASVGDSPKLLYRSTDHGATWVQVPGSGGQTGIACATDGTMYGVTDLAPGTGNCIQRITPTGVTSLAGMPYLYDTMIYGVVSRGADELWVSPVNEQSAAGHSHGLLRWNRVQGTWTYDVIESAQWAAWLACDTFGRVPSASPYVYYCTESGVVRYQVSEVHATNVVEPLELPATALVAGTVAPLLLPAVAVVESARVPPGRLTQPLSATAVAAGDFTATAVGVTWTVTAGC